MGGFVRTLTGERAAKAAERSSARATEAQLGAQTEALDYLKEREAIPQALREEALLGLGGVFGLEGGEGSQADLIERARTSPLYEAILGGREAGEEAILRHAGATGGLRSGDTQGALTDYGSQLQNQALLASYNEQLQGLQGLAGLPSNASQIAQGIAGLGTTAAQGEVAQGQAQQFGIGGKSELYGDLTKLGLGIAFSDWRLKTNVKPAGYRNGHSWFAWDWNEAARALGLSGSSEGVMAHLVKLVRPDAVGSRNGYLTVNLEKLGVV